MRGRFRRTLWLRVAQAIQDFSLIEDGDRIAVGLSGGKDSIALLRVLSILRHRAPVDFELVGVHVDLGWPDVNTDPLVRICDEWEIPLHTRKTRIAQVVFEERREKNPCSLCAKYRRAALNQLAKSLGCSKVALGHHADDAIETLFLNMTHEGRIGTLLPKTYMDRSGITQIRPLIYVKEETITRFVEAESLPIISSPCPAEPRTRRRTMKDLLTSLEQSNPHVKDTLIGAMKNVDVQNLWDRPGKP